MLTTNAVSCYGMEATHARLSSDTGAAHGVHTSSCGDVQLITFQSETEIAMMT